MHVLEVALIITHLTRWMEYVALTPAEERNHTIISLRRCRVLPLLELHDDCLRASALVVPGKHAVEPARGERKLQLHDDAVIIEIGELNRARHCLERSLPRANLTLRRPIPEVREEGLRQLLRD